MSGFIAKLVTVVTLILTGFAVLGASMSTESAQLGYSGTGMQQVAFKEDLEALVAASQAPPAFPPAASDGPRSSTAYQNVKVLGHLSTGEFTRLMTAITTWVSPVEGCAYCHNTENLASDELYTKVVSRRMIEMTMAINANFKSHVKETGVTCYTCHRGQPVPNQIWFTAPESPYAARLVGDNAEQNQPAALAGMTSLPVDPLTPYLAGSEQIRVISTGALPDGNRASIKQTEWTYGLMMHMSTSLGVNCTYCHNTRSMAEWEQSPPARAVAFHGIRMVRHLNNEYLTPLTSVFPPARRGALGDAPKINCGTCHNGAFKPLLGAQMLKDYKELAAPYVPTATTAAAPPPAEPAPVDPAAAPALGTP
ncbi:MAG: photosynthetic reaction center cytochrome c subunit [Deltaproteobacteria bacterium]|jgi:photosynthetic reaction center cytochrome c subunit|nr:photosynthetic reaction center cytochrome c subunit [Deltaproteobacteria bacterium]